jgi:hypothetical protein
MGRYKCAKCGIETEYSEIFYHCYFCDKWFCHSCADMHFKGLARREYRTALNKMKKAREEAEAEIERWKFDADTTRQAHTTTHARMKLLEADKAKLIEALMQTLPILRRHRKSMGQIPRPGTDPTFFHTLTYEGDIKELQKARRIHRNIRDVLAEMTRKEKGGGTDVPLKD